ncbi:hypothetical protein NJBCHELONAE_47700 [Mycobacteroides chelonae]|uniref:hypothetical protein n=1 Tax=Mycobacteroides chelonae TaxID=1774 RepID=UPI0021DF1423|nr:hypothetical protein [Mycobacteroides chelonae]GLE59457.1 hypothetical protein NJBCHELONAE_47700 [Mycobacteroides chelonae]
MTRSLYDLVIVQMNCACFATNRQSVPVADCERRYSLTWLTASLIPSYKAILNNLADLSARQLAEVGMAGQDLSGLFGTRKDQAREYHRFEWGLTRRLSLLDSQPGQPAHRITNDAHRVIVNSRTPQQQQDYAEAAERLRIVMNKSVAGSIRNPQPQEARGGHRRRRTISTSPDRPAGSEPRTT